MAFATAVHHDCGRSFGHLEADLRLVAAATQPTSEMVLYGLLMWKAYYNNATSAPGGATLERGRAARESQLYLATLLLTLSCCCSETHTPM